MTGRVLSAMMAVLAGVFLMSAGAAMAADPARETSPEEAITAKQDFSLKIEPVPYNGKGRRDPFVSIIALEKKKKETLVARKRKNPLENVDVTDFKLLGIIYDGKEYYASVVLPDNKAYTLKKGMKVGLYGGMVYKITPSGIVIKEEVTDFLGKLKPKYTELKLRKEEVQ